MKEIIDKAKDLKSAAIRERDRTHPNWVKAIELLQEAKDLLLKILPHPVDELGRTPDSGSVGPMEKDLVLQLANICGSLGGAFRGARQYEKAVLEYDAGESYESLEQYHFVSSYNLTQRLVTRVLLEPAWIFEGGRKMIQGLPFPEALEAARDKIDQQLDGPRRDDEWAVADRAMVGLLLQEQANIRHWEKLARVATSAFVFDATLRVLEDIRREFELPRKAPMEEERRCNFVRRLTEAIAAMSTLQAS